MYSKRAKFLKESEAAQWDKIVYRNMTEESDDSDSDGIVQRHKLEWRSIGNGSKFVEHVTIAQSKHISVAVVLIVPNRM